MKMNLNESQARHLLEPLLSSEEKPSQLKALVQRVMLIPEGQGGHYGIRNHVFEPVIAGAARSGSILEALLPDAIFRVAVLDEGWPPEQAALLYYAACVIVS